MSRRSQLLRFQASIPAQRSAPVEVKVVQPDELCCPCCANIKGGCATPNEHVDKGCELMTHRVSPGWTA